MKLGDMTFRQIAELCDKYELCIGCPFNYYGSRITDTGCKLKDELPSNQYLDMEVNTDAENQS